MIELVRDLPQCTIAAINGPAVTGGLELALSCDIRLCDETATFADTHVRVGIPPGAGASVALSRLIGPGRAKELSLSGRFLKAADAERWGLVNRVVDDVLREASELAREIAANGPFLRHIKELVDVSLGLPVGAAYEHERAAFRQFAANYSPAAVDAVSEGVMSRGRQEVASDRDRRD